MIALADANSFFVSCEWVYNPKYRNTPSVVLSNNDRCVVAMSKETKALGIKRGTPIYQIQKQIKQHDIKLFSSNYELYGQTSRFLMSGLGSFTPDLKVTSIDEAFLDLTGIEDLYRYGREIVQYISRAISIPISIGIAPSKTLAKMANMYAKKYPGYKRVCVIDTDEKRIKALKLTKVADIWGIGDSYTDLLNYHSIHTAYDLSQKSRSWVRKYITVVGERLWMELHGIPCIQDEDLSEKKNIGTSRTFDQPVTDFGYLMEQLSNFAAKGAYKLRQQHSLTQGLIVSIYTNRFDPRKPQYTPAKYIRLSYPTLDTGEIISQMRMGLESIYLPGIEYKRAEIILTDITREANFMPDFYDTTDRFKQSRLNKATDCIRQRFGYNSIQTAVQGNCNYLGNLRRDHLTKCPSTRFSDIIEIY